MTALTDAEERELNDVLMSTATPEQRLPWETQKYVPATPTGHDSASTPTMPKNDFVEVVNVPAARKPVHFLLAGMPKSGASSILERLSKDTFGSKNVLENPARWAMDFDTGLILDLSVDDMNGPLTSAPVPTADAATTGEGAETKSQSVDPSSLRPVGGLLVVEPEPAAPEFQLTYWEAARRLASDLRARLGPRAPIVLLINKMDLGTELRADEYDRFCSKNGVRGWYKVSAFRPSGLSEPLWFLAFHALNHMASGDGQQAGGEGEGEAKGGCVVS